MAASLTHVSSDTPGHTTECSKCHQLLKNPKSLPCLHSYCVTCLENEIGKEPKKTEFSCLICREEFDIPAGGVKEWRSLSIVHKLTEQKAMQVKLMTKDSLRCTSCPEPGSKHDTTDEKCDPPIAVARCTECDDYLCQRCVSVHKSVRIRRNHPVYTLEELRAGKVSSFTTYERIIRATRASTLKREFGHDGQEPLKLALDVVMMASGNYAVTDHSAANVKLFNPTGVYKSSFNVKAWVDAGKGSNPWCIKVGPDNLFYVTEYASPFVKIFDLGGKYKRHFWTVSPDKVPYSSHGSSSVCGLAFDSKQQVLAGNTTHNFISRHALDGTHISSVKVQIRPMFLAVTSEDQVVVSSYSTSGEVHIIDETGQILSKLENEKPTGVSSWYPTGVVTSTKYKINDGEDEIFVADRYNGHCIHRYSGSGKFLNTVTQYVSNVFGITLSANEQQLIVADTSRVKCFDI